jgi:hypothetical protein
MVVCVIAQGASMRFARFMDDCRCLAFGKCPRSVLSGKTSTLFLPLTFPLEANLEVP